LAPLIVQNYIEQRAVDLRADFSEISLLVPESKRRKPTELTRADKS